MIVSYEPRNLSFYYSVFSFCLFQIPYLQIHLFFLLIDQVCYWTPSKFFTAGIMFSVPIFKKIFSLLMHYILELIEHLYDGYFEAFSDNSCICFFFFVVFLFCWLGLVCFYLYVLCNVFVGSFSFVKIAIPPSLYRLVLYRAKHSTVILVRYSERLCNLLGGHYDVSGPIVQFPNCFLMFVLGVLLFEKLVIFCSL